MNNDDGIKWNKKKHDDHTKEAGKKDFLNKLGKMFTEWKRQLCAKKRTPEEVFDYVEKLKLNFQQMVSTPGLDLDKEFIDFTTQLIDEQAAKALAADFIHTNSITEYVPKYTADGSEPEDTGIIFEADRLRKAPRSFRFKTPRDFYAIPFVRLMAGRPGFVCFIRDNDWVRGVFKDGEVVALGKLDNLIGLEKMPTKEEFAAETARSPEPKAGPDTPEPGDGTAPPSQSGEGFPA